LEAVDNVDVFVDLKDGSRWSATMIALAQVEDIMARWAESGKPLEAAISGAQTDSSSGTPASAT
jgi:hypothetical protein